MFEENREKETKIYIIDDNFRIIYSNDNVEKYLPEFKYGQACYQVICQEGKQCKKCPLLDENHGQSILYDKLHNEWVNASATEIEWPGAGTCRVLMCKGAKDIDENIYQNARGKSDYDELLELNYLEDTYHIVYHGELKDPEKKLELKGKISTMVKRFADRLIHPDDKKSFFDFWLLDKIGIPGVPKELLVPRHSEFRKLYPDGKYRWVQQLHTPVRQSSKDEIFVNCYYNIIEEAKSQSDESAENPGAKYSKKQFFSHAEKLFRNKPEGQNWCIVAIDIEKLKLFNEWYGKKAGDDLLADVFWKLKEVQENMGGAVGYFENDDFALLMPYDREEIERLYTEVAELIKSHSGKIHVLPAFGIYEVVNEDIPAFKAYDRANLACTSVKGNYIKRIKKFKDTMLQSLESEYLLFADIQEAFRNKEFSFVLQPKCNMENGRIVGAEALARWNNKEKGQISPGVFIPFLEKNGFVSELDSYIWEEVCKWQRSMLDRGLLTVPVSVNVSRADLYSMNVPEYFCGLIEKYDLSADLIKIEITESAYSEDVDIISDIVSNLRKAGFTVLMDDFGSAYSSLNMLKDIEVDVLKIDMRFLSFNEENSSRGFDILQTVCSMAQILGLKFIAEGVENQTQRDYLLRAGCRYAQGYYYFRPLLVKDFEEVIANPENIEEALATDSTELFNIKDLLNKNMLSQHMLSNMLGAVAFYDVYEDNISIHKFNDQYAELFGTGASSMETQMVFGEQLYEDEYAKVLKMFDDAQKQRNMGAATTLRRRKPDGTDMWLRLRVFFLYKRDEHSIFYSTVEDVTESQKSNLILQFLNNDMPGGYYRHKNTLDGEFTHISKRFLDIFGFSREEIKLYFDDKFTNMVHPEDLEKVHRSMTSMEQTGGNYSMPCRMRSKNGYISVIDQSRLVKFGNDEIFQGIILCDLDHYKMFSDDNDALSDENVALNLLPCGIFQAEADEEHQFSYISNSMLRMLGYSREAFEEKFHNRTENLVYKDDLQKVNDDFERQIHSSNYIATEFRVEMADGSLKWVYSRGRMTTDEKGKRWFYVCMTDFDYLKKQQRDYEWRYQKYKTLAEIPGMIVYDYDPMTDCLTVEMSDENGYLQTVVAENYIEKFEEHGIVSPECAEEQKLRIRQATEKKVNGITEFRGKFSDELGLRWYRFYYQSLTDESGQVYRIVGRGDDISNEKDEMSSWKNRAMMDSLTGLLNHETAKDMAQKILIEQSCGTVFLIDMDNFKEVNDSLGHLAGDELLKQMAEIIQSTFRKQDIAARFDGDEFMIFIPGFSDKQHVESRAAKLLKKVSEIHLREELQVHCSIGIASAGDDISFDMLFNQADLALYSAKYAGKNKFVFFNDEF